MQKEQSPHQGIKNQTRMFDYTIHAVHTDVNNVVTLFNVGKNGMQLTKAFVSETSCNQLLIDTAT